MSGPSREPRRAVVTGAGAGIGAAIARRLVADGARVVVADLDGAAAARVASELAPAALAATMDVRDGEQMRATVARAVDAWGGLDVHVNNAGIGTAGTVETTTEDDFERLMSVNVRGTFLGMKHAVPALRASGGGAIVNVASIAALVGLPHRAAYSAAKGAIYALTRAAAIDHVGEGIRINCIAPGTVETPWVDRMVADQPDPVAARQTMLERQPHGRFVQADEIAAMAAYLASDDALSVVGACMVVDGGLTAR